MATTSTVTLESRTLPEQSAAAAAPPTTTRKRVQYAALATVNTR